MEGKSRKQSWKDNYTRQLNESPVGENGWLVEWKWRSIVVLHQCARTLLLWDSLKCGVTAFCVLCVICSSELLVLVPCVPPSLPHKTIQCYVFPSSRTILGLNKTKGNIWMKENYRGITTSCRYAVIIFFFVINDVAAEFTVCLFYSAPSQKR